MATITILLLSYNKAQIITKEIGQENHIHTKADEAAHTQVWR